MHSHHLLAALCCTITSFAQKSDTLFIYYKSGQYNISGMDKQRLDSFLARGWDRISVNGYTDETDSEEYNLKLSQKRSGTVYRYILAKNFPAGNIEEQYFGETMPLADNETEDGRALNRRTLIAGYQYPRVKVKAAVPLVNAMQPLTRELDNGFIITYRPGTLPEDMAAYFGSGSGSVFQLVTNTTEMRENNLFNNTTRGEILSSMLIICGQRMNPCSLDSPILVQVPVPAHIKCPVSKVKFFNAVLERGRRIWQEETRLLTTDTINGRPYVGVWLNNFCECVNFDFKIDPDCFDTDSTRVFYTMGTIRNLSTELYGLNSVYMPRMINDSTQSIIYLKHKLQDAALSFYLYKDKRRIRGYKNKQLADFPFDSASGRYLLGTGSKQFFFPRLDVWDVVLKVNGDRYRVPEDDRKFNFTYLQYKKDSILVDFTITESGRRVTVYRDQPLSKLPYDSVRGRYVIDRKFLKESQQKKSVAGR